MAQARIKDGEFDLDLGWMSDALQTYTRQMEQRQDIYRPTGRFASLRCKVRLCMFNARAVADTLPSCSLSTR